MTTEQVKEQLQTLAEDDYKAFNENLLPGVKHILGVRLPLLRKIAKEIAKTDCRVYLNEAAETIGAESFYEELMIQGLVIGYAKFGREERVRYLDEFVPKIQSWGICDSCTMGFKFMQKEPEFWFSYIRKYKDSSSEFELRFLLVALLAHYVEEAHIREILDLCNTIHHEGYYVKMAAAWLVSVCYVKFPEQTKAFLCENQMDDFTHNKSIQKIRESYRVSKEEKEELNKLKRKGQQL